MLSQDTFTAGRNRSEFGLSNVFDRFKWLLLRSTHYPAVDFGDQRHFCKLRRTDFVTPLRFGGLLECSDQETFNSLPVIG